MIELDHIGVSYDGQPVARDISLSVPAGGWTCLIGPNGAGKTTVLKAIAGLVSFAGKIRVDGSSLAEIRRRRVAQLIAFVPQRPSVPEGMSVIDYVLIGRTPYISYLGTESRMDIEVVSEVLDRMELGSFSARTLGSLSGGEVQRAVMARALAQQAPVLLLDEPTSSLDVGHQQRVLELIDELRRERALTILSSMHDLTLAGQFAGTLVMLSEGRAVGVGPARSVLTEAAIREHYGASMRVMEDADGRIVVIPTRSHPAELDPRAPARS